VEQWTDSSDGSQDGQVDALDVGAEWTIEVDGEEDLWPGRHSRIDDRRLADLLAAGSSQRGAARQLGCDERTVRRRLASSAFRKLFLEARARLRVDESASVAGLKRRALAATDLLLEDEDPRVRLAAIRMVLGVESSEFRAALGELSVQDNKMGRGRS
jgi:hypothetical protein